MSRLAGSTNSGQSFIARRHRPDLLLLLFLSVLLLLGLVVIYAISPALTARMAGDVDQNMFMYRQLFYLGAGLIAFTVAAVVPISFWTKAHGKLLIGAIILGALPFLLQATPIGLCANDACRWIDLGFISFQPAEAMKFALVIFLAVFLSARAQQGKLSDFHQTLFPAGLILLAMAIVVIGLQKDLGTGITIVAIVMTMLFVANMKARLLGIAAAGCLVLGILFTLIAPHRIERILTFVQHESSASDAMGYHINQALIAVGSGGLTGKGLGQSIQAFGYLPEAANDSIFAILAEKFGFLGTIAVLAIFAALFIRILGIMDHTADPTYRLIVAGVFGWVFSHTVVNIGAMLGVFPLTGITLPFVSFGGTSLLFMLSALGLVFQISRYTNHVKSPDNQKIGGLYDNRERGRGLGRTRHSGTRRTS
ncbi:MAG TPA: putative peptidoglycan glycosyltransferase FtsW [Magnetospirillaceae bacterium]|nr:putative peptidoglycan glycosyltransferase FtsW [Magnetospirillaceae bacterium]